MREAEFHFVAGGEIIFDARLLAPEREKPAAVQMPEHDLSNAVLLKQVGKERRLPLDVEGRIVDERDERVPFAAHLFHLLKGEAEALGFPQIERPVVLGEVGAAGTGPAARARDDDAVKLHAVVLQEEKAVVGTGGAHAGDARPPVIVIAADEHLAPGEGGEAGDVVHPLRELHPPRGVAAHEDDVLFADLLPPVGGDLFKMSLPAFAEHVHRLWDEPREVQIADRKNFHVPIIAYFARFGKPFPHANARPEGRAHDPAAYFFRMLPALFARIEIDLLRRERDLRETVAQMHGVQPIAVVVRGDIDAVAEDIVLVLVLAVGIVVFDMYALQFRRRPRELAPLPVRRTRKVRPLARLHQPAHALIVESLRVGQRVDGDVRFKTVVSFTHLAADVLPLPGDPVGDVGKLRFPLLGFEFGEGAHLPCLAAGGAPQTGAFGIHFKLPAAVRALIEDVVQPVGALRVLEFDRILALIGVVVPLHGGVDAAVQFVRRERAHLLGGGDALQFAAKRQMLLVLVPLRRGDERPVKAKHDGGNVHELAHLAEGIGQKARRPVQRIARLGIEADDGAVVFGAIAHIADEREIAHELALADAAEAAHEPVADIAHGVDGDDVVGVIGRDGGVHRGKIQHTCVRDKEQIGRFDALHADLLHGDGTPFEARPDGERARDPHPERARLHRAPGKIIMFDLFVRFSLVRHTTPILVFSR